MNSFNPNCPLKQAISRSYTDPRVDVALRGALLGISLICAGDLEFYRSGLEDMARGLDTLDVELMNKGSRDIQMKRRLKGDA